MKHILPPALVYELLSDVDVDMYRTEAVYSRLLWTHVL